MKIGPLIHKNSLAQASNNEKTQLVESLVPGEYPQVQKDMRSFPEPVLNLMDRYGIKIAVLEAGQTLNDSPALRTLSQQEYSSEKAQAKKLTFKALQSTQATSISDFVEKTTRDFRKNNLDFHFGMASGEPDLGAIAAQQGIAEKDFPKWSQSFQELNSEFLPHFFILPHVYHNGEPIPENTLRGSREVSAEYVEGSLGLNRAEDRLVLLHKKFTTENAVEVGNYRLALHEAGHALDHILDRLTSMPGFGTMHRATVDALYEKDLAKAEIQGIENTFTTKRASENVREFFAEAVEAYLTDVGAPEGEIFRTENSKSGLESKNIPLSNYIEKIMTSDFTDAEIPKPPTRKLFPDFVPDPDTAVLYF